MGDRIGKRQKQMLAWLFRTGPNTYVGWSTPATYEISGWELSEAKRVLRSLRARGLVNCKSDGSGTVNLSAEGRPLGEQAMRELNASYNNWLSERDRDDESQEPPHA